MNNNMQDMLTKTPAVHKKLIFDNLNLHELLSLRRTNRDNYNEVNDYIQDNLDRLVATTTRSQFVAIARDGLGKRLILNTPGILNILGRDGLVEIASISPAHTRAVVNNQQAINSLGYNGLIDITYFGRDYQAAIIRSNVLSPHDKTMILDNIRQRAQGNIEESRSNDYKRSGLP